MKLTKISRAVLATCGTLASVSAFALPASNYTNTGEFTGTTQNIRISGATAQDNGLLGSALSLCTPGSLHRYAISNNFVYLCTPDVGTNPGQIQVRAGATQLAVYKYSVGGSGAGVEPVDSNSTLPFLDLAKLATSPLCSGTNVVTSTPDFDGTGPLATYVNFACNTATANIASLTTGATTYVGLSDVEPSFFSTSTGNLLAENFSTLIFGVPVSTNIRNALQSAQGLTIGNDTLAQMPTLTSAQINSAFTQLGQTWNGIGLTNTHLTAGGVTDPAIYVARRVDSSGTQKTFEALVAKTPNGESNNKSCVIGVEPFLQPDSLTTTGDASATCAGSAAGGTLASPVINYTGPTVFAGSGGGDVSACMNGHNTAGRGTIGMQTGETKPGASGWRFVKVDGNAPIHADVASGRYPLWTQASINTRINVNPTASALGYSAFVSRIKADLANPTIVALINGSNQTFGPSGLMANYVSGTPDFTGASVINPMNRLVGGTVVNNCQPAKAPF